MLMTICTLSVGCVGVHHATPTSKVTAISIGRGKAEEPDAANNPATTSASSTSSIAKAPAVPDAAPKSGNGDTNGKKEDKKEEPKHIRDNAILVEEAFNQEPGEVQHIFVWQNFWDRTSQGRTRDFSLAYTMELPLGSQKHQFSFTAQHLTHFDDPNIGPAAQQGDVGDTFLNYRYQLLADEEFLWCAPRFSVILPTGDRYLGTGTGAVGYQFNLPVSHYGAQFDFHFNAGCTYTPDVAVPISLVPKVLSPRHDLRGYNLGASVYWKPKVNFHLYVEALALWRDEIDEWGSRVSTTQVFISPGLRFAVIQEPLEWVLGVGVPIGLTRAAPDIGVFAYMSIEHPFRKKKNGD